MSPSEKPFVVRSHNVHLDEEYVAWMGEVRSRFHVAQVRAAVKVNAEQLLFNWQLGRDLVARKAEERWGAGIVEQVSLDLKAAFPVARGFSASNLWHMKRWYSFYATRCSSEKLEQLVIEIKNGLSGSNNQASINAALPETHAEDTADGNDLEFPSLFSRVPWGHHIAIISKCASVEEALFYIGRVIEEGLSREGLKDAIASDLYHRSGGIVSNFAERLPAAQARLAQEITKSTYDFGFVQLSQGYRERDLEDALERNITRFLLELGQGFAYVGRQKEMVVAGRSRSLDMLFYHIKLRCYVVVELKAVEFEPEFAGKLNFYVNATDELIKSPAENPTIGLLICKYANSTDVQWAFRGISTPMGVATYTNVQIKEMEAQLPTVEQIQEQIKLTEEEVRLSRRGEADE